MKHKLSLFFVENIYQKFINLQLFLKLVRFIIITYLSANN